jgi:hypothetical protein
VRHLKSELMYFRLHLFFRNNTFSYPVRISRLAMNGIIRLAEAFQFL